MTQLGAQLIGVSEEQESDAPVSWWDDTLSLARVGAGVSRSTSNGLGTRQVEFWVDEDLKPRQASPAVCESRTAYCAEPVKAAAREEEMCEPSKKTVRKDGGAVKTRPGTGRPPIARFLSVNGGVYDGRDERRWLALPEERDSGLRFQFMKKRDADPNVDFKVDRTVPRDFGGMSCR